MHRKTRTLGAEDRRAVDLLLDHGARGRAAVTHVPVGVPHRRMAAAARLLSVLEVLPSVEPPADLLARTMDRITAGSAHPSADAGVSASAMLH